MRWERPVGRWVDKFFSKVTKGASCWLWQGPVHHNGYGVASSNGGIAFELYHKRMAHQISWIIHKGLIPAGVFVLHHCDTPLCVNPQHLYLGDNAKNMRDRGNRGRTARNRGEKHGRSKLTWEQVREIRTLYGSRLGSKAHYRNHPEAPTRIKLASMFKISRSQINYVLDGLGWHE
jgi:hypothetical protein